jgi:predicted DNA-binding transcriptional regulator YafY
MITLLEGSHKKWTAGDLAEYFGISERTFHHDRQTLENIGVPLYYDLGKRTYNIMDTYSFSPPEFTRDEAIALTLAARVVREYNWHPSQELKELPGGKVLFRVRTGSTMEIKRRIILALS